MLWLRLMVVGAVLLLAAPTLLLVPRCGGACGDCPAERAAAAGPHGSCSCGRSAAPASGGEAVWTAACCCPRASVAQLPPATVSEAGVTVVAAAMVPVSGETVRPAPVPARAAARRVPARAPPPGARAPVVLRC